MLLHKINPAQNHTQKPQYNLTSHHRPSTHNSPKQTTTTPETPHLPQPHTNPTPIHTAHTDNIRLHPHLTYWKDTQHNTPHKTTFHTCTLHKPNQIWCITWNIAKQYAPTNIITACIFAFLDYITFQEPPTALTKHMSPTTRHFTQAAQRAGYSTSISKHSLSLTKDTTVSPAMVCTPIIKQERCIHTHVLQSPGGTYTILAGIYAHQRGNTNTTTTTSSTKR